MENKEIINNIKTSDIIPYERNARKNDQAVKEVVKSIERTGYRTPIIIDENLGFENVNINFLPGNAEDQGKLDELKPRYVICPDCGKEFNINES